jgi:glutamate formiminotransferase/formiminotetrahydrofolate cyclodeaminase
MHLAFEEVKKEANRLGVEVTGSEIVGLVPLEALLQAGIFYSEGKSLSEEEFVNLATDKLGLSSLNDFHPKEKIIDYMI